MGQLFQLVYPRVQVSFGTNERQLTVVSSFKSAQHVVCKYVPFGGNIRDL
jgi:hypothetical protein